MVAESGGDDGRTGTRVTFDARVYALQVIKKAAYRFLRELDVAITQEGDSWVCTLTFASPASTDAIERAERELRAEVLDQDLRASIARETEPVRNAILALAFSRTGLQGSE
jgi:His-Xaa-Ser system protein HxsD